MLLFSRVQLFVVHFVVQSLSRVQLFVAPWTAAHQASLEFAQTHVHRVGDAIQPSHPVTLFSSSPQSFPASGPFPLSQLLHYAAIDSEIVGRWGGGAVVKSPKWNSSE